VEPLEGQSLELARSYLRWDGTEVAEVVVHGDCVQVCGRCFGWEEVGYVVVPDVMEVSYRAEPGSEVAAEASVAVLACSGSDC
jgi:hypothetical protein